MTTNNTGPRVPAPDDLRALGRLDDRDREFGQGLRAHLLRQAHDAMPASSIERTVPMTSAGATITTGTQPWRYGLRARLISIAAAVALALGGSAAYLLRVQAPTPVSAQTVLRHAAATLAATSAGEVSHVMSTFYFGPNSSFGAGSQTLGSGPITYTVDQQTQYDATGAISRQVASGTTITGTLLFSMVRTGQAARLYGPRANAVEEFAVPRSVGFSWADNPLGVAPRQLILAVQRDKLQNVRLLPQQSFDGATVYVVESSYTDLAPPGAPETGVRLSRHIFRLYIDAGTYAIQGMDSLQVDAGAAPRIVENMRVTKRETMALSSLAAGAFALHAPASARVVRSSYDLLSVAQALARPDEPAPLLADDAQGLRLQQITLEHTSRYNDLTYDYQNGLSFPGAFDLESFTVIVEPTASMAAAASSETTTVTSTLSLTVAGKRVRATYEESTARSSLDQRVLTYQDGATTVHLVGTRLSKDRFFATVGALVDGHRRPDVAAALQRELDTP